MEKFLLDTCTWIEFFHERNGVPEHARKAGRDVKVYDISEVFEEYGQIRCALNKISKKKAKEVGQFDMLIGATALHYGLTVVTDNVKDFSLMPGVKCVNWVER